VARFLIDRKPKLSDGQGLSVGLRRMMIQSLAGGDFNVPSDQAPTDQSKDFQFGGSGGPQLEFRREGFDSALLHHEVGRIVLMQVSQPEEYPLLFRALIPKAQRLGFTQVLRRVAAADLEEVWALQRTGFELMDIGLTFARTLREPVVPTDYDDLIVRTSSDDDIEHIVARMLEHPWGSRYESDPSYSSADVRALRERWLWNSHRGRASAFLIGQIEQQPAGYVTCLLDERAGHGVIELVGTLPRFRGRRVAQRLVEHAVAWFSTRATRVTVRTQATNFAAASVYERSGFTLDSSDLTFRLTLSAANDNQPA
jgi:GNAT superfamily N-acetyltransferase